MKKIKIIGFALCVMLLGACSNDDETDEYVIADTKIGSDVVELRQLQEENNIEVVMKTNQGDIHLILFEDVAPLAVENFVTLSKEGYYDGLTFHRVIKDFMIQGGDPTASGSGGESIWDKAFNDEFDLSARNFYGSLSMANAGANTNGSQFFIVQGSEPISEEQIEDYYASLYAEMLVQEAVIRIGEKAPDLSEEEYNLYFEAEEKKLAEDMEKAVPEEFKKIVKPIVDEYINIGGTPWLDGVHTVFGYVVEGMDIVESIASVEVDGNQKPTSDVIINSIQIVE